MAITFKDNAIENSPPWLQGPNGSAFLKAFGDQKDWLASLIDQAVKARFPGKSIDRTNLCLYSEQFNNAAWQKTTGVAVTANADTAPDGTATADQVAYDGTGVAGDWRIGQWTIETPAAGSGRTVSIWMRSASPVTLVLHGFNPDSSVTCSVTSTWQRFQVPVTSDGGGTSIAIYSPVSVNAAFTVSLWGAQVEAGSVATIYIPTTSLPVTVSIPDRNSAPSDALPFIGEERGLARGISEPEAQYRARLVAAWEAWGWAGTPFGLLRAFQLAGYPSVLLQCQSGKQFQLGVGGTISDLVIADMATPVHLGGSPSELWSDIGVVIQQPWPSWWGGSAPADGSSDQKTAAALILKWKNAHNRCVSLKVVSGLVWDGGATWDGGGRWDSGTSTTWTPPAG